jgi:BolA protein
MRIADRIETKLRAALTPARLIVTDESSLHAGHAGAMPGGETHFRVEIVSAAFEGLSRVARHRMVHTLLAEEFRDGVHALTLTLATPAGI